jgi:hypothetical protein
MWCALLLHPNDELLLTAIAVANDVPHFLSWWLFVYVIFKVGQGNNKLFTASSNGRALIWFLTYIQDLAILLGATEKTIPSS